MLIVVFSNTDAEFDALYKAIAHEQCGQVASFNVGAMSESAASALLARFGNMNTEQTITLLRNPAFADLPLLRAMGAVVCHRYTLLSRRYKTERLIEHGDLFYVTATRSEVPAHVLRVDELLSEAKIRHRQRVRAHAAA
jgi:hypothetical protein